MDSLLSIALGVGLAAACGLRVFVPFLVLGAAQRLELVEVGKGFAWLGSDAGMLALLVATLCEVLAYYVPWIDNALDAIATPMAVIAGVLVTAAVTPELDPWARWSLAVIAGGGVAGVLQGVTVAARHASSLFTLGTGNWLIATLELFGSLAMALLALAVPFLVAGIALVLFGWAVLRRRRRQAAAT